MNELNFRTLDLNLLRVFDEVMAERNLARAAHNLALSQPAVSHALRRLREALGDDLVRCVGYGVELTPLALQLWPAVREALQRLRESLAPGALDPAPAVGRRWGRSGDRLLSGRAGGAGRHPLAGAGAALSVAAPV